MPNDVRLVITGEDAGATKVIQNIEKTSTSAAAAIGLTWRQFTAERMGEYMKTEGGHAGAMKRMGAEWQQYKASGVAASAAVVTAMDKADRAKTALTEKTSALNKELKSVKTSSDSLGGSFDMLKTAAAGVMAGFGVTELVQARIELDKIKNSLAATSGATAGSDYKFMRGEVERLGLSLQSTAKDFGLMTASTKGTSLEGEQTRKIFSAITGASTVLGLSADDTSGILRSLNQMISKGTVQSEELKGQLGERLPGAMAVAARVMGMTTAELQKHLETGTVLASDLLPKLAVELEKTYGAQTAASARSTQAELNRLHTTFFELKTKAADGDTFADFFRTAAGATKLLSNNLDVVKVGLVAVIGSSVISGLTALAAKITAVGTAGAVAQAGLYGMAAATGYAIGKGIDLAVYKVTGFDISGMNETEAGRKRLAEAQGKLDQVSEKLRAAEVARNTEKEKAAQATKEAEALMVKELEVFKAHQEAKTALTREQKDIELAELKGAYDRGLVSTENYYQREKQIALEAAQQELANTKDYLAQESALLANIKGRSKDGKKTTEYVEELAKHEKALNAVQMAELKLSKVSIEENNKMLAALKTRDDAELKALQDHQKNLRQYADNYADLQDKIAAGNGMDSAWLSAKSALHDEISKKLELENNLNLARQTGNIAEYNYLQLMISGETIRIGQLTAEVELKRRAANLSAQNNTEQIIINDLLAKGLTDEAFWLQKKIDLRNLEAKIQQDQIEYDRQMVQALSAGNDELLESLNLARGITAERNRAAGNAINDRLPGSASPGTVADNGFGVNSDRAGSTLGGFNFPAYGPLATGTNRVPADGYAYLHKDEAVVPAKYNPAVNGQADTSSAPITIQSAQFILPNVTNQTSANELFRQLAPMLDKYNERTKRRA